MVTQGEATIAAGPDYDALPLIQQDLAWRALLPAELLVDASYVTAEHLVSSQQGLDLLGAAAADQHWQHQEEQGFDQNHFSSDWAARVATGPQGHHRVSWKLLWSRDG